MKNLIILHGALGASSQLEPLKELLSPHMKVYLLDFDGHGPRSPLSVAFSIAHFAMNLRKFMEVNTIEKPLVFGYSMGGYVALKLERMEANSFERIVTLGTKFDWNPESAEKEAKMLNAEKIEEKVPAFAAYLKALHGEEEWKEVLERTARMMLQLGNDPALNPEDFQKIRIPVRLLRGSKDVMVTEEETRKVCSELPHAGYEEIAAWQHPINLVPPGELAQQLLRLYLPG